MKKRIGLVVVILSVLASMTLLQPAAAATQLDQHDVYLCAIDSHYPGFYTNGLLKGTMSSWYVEPGHYRVIFDGWMGFTGIGGVALTSDGTIVSVQTWNQQGLGYYTQGGGVGSGAVSFVGGGLITVNLKVTWDLRTSSYSAYVFLRAESYDDIDVDSFYLSLYSGGGCPSLLVWDGSRFVDEGVLNIHNLVNPESDVVVQHTLTTTPVLTDHNRYSLKLAEIGAGYDYSHSWIDQVKLYAVDDEGVRQLCPLVFANSSRYGNVLPLLLRSDDMWTQTFKGDGITLQFIAPRIDNVAQFVFIIEGHNAKQP